MLEKENWQSVLEVTQFLGGTAFDFYADAWSHRNLSFEKKQLRLKTSETGGARLITQTDRGPRSFQSTLLDPKRFCTFIQTGVSPSPTFDTASLSKSFSAIKSQDAFLEHIFRRLLLEIGAEEDFSASFQEHKKNFLVAHDLHGLRQGSESIARFHLDFVLRKGNETKSFSFKKGATETPVLLNELENWSLSKDQLEKALEKPWPAPKGTLALHWSSQSVAKLGACFLKMLEFFSRDAASFSQWTAQWKPLSFQLIDNWKSETKIDVEGKERAPIFLVNGNQIPTPFNEKVAGFARRQTHSHFPITAPWEPALFGLERTSEILEQMRDGISVGDIELKSFHIPSGTVSFYLKEATLVHQGVKGEYIEPVILQTQLIELLNTFKLFSEKTSPTPLDWTSCGQNLFVEFTAPEALSPQFELNGSVPCSHYW